MQFYDTSLLSVIIPAYNEEKNIQRFRKELFPFLDELKIKYEVLIIDDGSTDNTLNEIRKLEKDKRLNVKLIKHLKNMGLGAGIRSGIEYSKGDLIVCLDSDLTFHPKEIVKLFQKFNPETIDCVNGSFLLAKGSSSDVKSFRLFLSKSINMMYSLLLGKKTTAITPIFRLYKTGQLKELNLTSTDFNINAEILFKLIQNKRRIIEVPVTLTKRIYGESKISILKEIRNHASLLFKIFLWKLKIKK